MRFWQKAKRYLNAAPAALVLFVAACGGGGSSAPQAPPPAPPSSSFSVSSSTGTAPFSVTFTDTSNAGTSAITSWEWDFGDGTTSTDQNPVHEYVGVGNYDVSLTVTTNVGSDTEARSSAVTVDPSPTFIEPEAIATFADPYEGDILAAENQVLAILEEGLTQADFDTILASAEANGALFQALDRDLLMVQFRVNSGDELIFRDFLGQQTGVLFSFLNRVEPKTQVAFAGDTVQQTYASRDVEVEKVPPSLGVDTTNGGFWWLSTIRAAAAGERLAIEDNLPTTIMAVIDTGLPENQPIISDQARIISRLDAFGGELSGDPEFDANWDSPLQNHGYLVSGFALGYNDETESVIRGVNPHDSLISIDTRGVRVVIDDGSLTFTGPLISGTKTAINAGAKVVNISYGVSDSFCSLSLATGIAASRFRSRYLGLTKFARDNDVNLVFAAGNACEKSDDDLFPAFGSIVLAQNREKYEDYWRSNIVSVGATDRNNKDACFSVMGQTVDILAPGAAVGFTDDAIFGGAQRVWSGTSYAAPIVAGALTLVRSVNPQLEAPEAKYVLLQNSRDNQLVFRTGSEIREDCGLLATGLTFFGATGPNKQLDLQRAVQGAILTRNVSLEEPPGLQLSLGENAETTIEVTVPDSGVTALDLVFLVDQSSSYGDDIDTLQAQANTIIQDLESRNIDIQYAVVGFSDFPISPYGISTDREFNLLQDLTDDEVAARNAIDLLDQPLLLGGFTFPEGQYEALFRSATELSFRDGALPVIVLATDADFHNSDVEPNYPGTGRLETIATLKERGVKVIGLLSGTSSTAAERLEELAVETDGAFFRLDSSSSEIAQAIADAVEAAVRLADISLEIVSGGPWIESISPAVVNDVLPGETATFTVEFVGQKAPSIFSDDNDYDAYIWARSNGTALLGRYKQNIRP